MKSKKAMTFAAIATAAVVMLAGCASGGNSGSSTAPSTRTTVGSLTPHSRAVRSALASRALATSSCQRSHPRRSPGRRGATAARNLLSCASVAYRIAQVRYLG